MLMPKRKKEKKPHTFLNNFWTKEKSKVQLKII